MLMSGLKYQVTERLNSVREGRKSGSVTLVYRDSCTAAELLFLYVNNNLFESVGI